MEKRNDREEVKKKRKSREGSCKAVELIYLLLPTSKRSAVSWQRVGGDERKGDVKMSWPKNSPFCRNSIRSIRARELNGAFGRLQLGSRRKKIHTCRRG